jgi:hypothetical protein
MLTVITDRLEIQKLQSLFQSKLREHCSEQFHCIIGYPGGSGNENVRYSSEFNLWTVDKEDIGYWNGFGLGRPSNNTCSLTVVIHFPYEGINRKMAGVFAVTDNGNNLVFHRGKIGGGSPGIGKNFFLGQFNNLETADDGDRQTSFCLVGDLSSPLFVSQVADFVSKTRRIRDGRG